MFTVEMYKEYDDKKNLFIKLFKAYNNKEYGEGILYLPDLIKTICLLYRYDCNYSDIISNEPTINTNQFFRSINNQQEFEKELCYFIKYINLYKKDISNYNVRALQLGNLNNDEYNYCICNGKNYKTTKQIKDINVFKHLTNNLLLTDYSKYLIPDIDAFLNKHKIEINGGYYSDNMELTILLGIVLTIFNRYSLGFNRTVIYTQNSFIYDFNRYFLNIFKLIKKELNFDYYIIDKDNAKNEEKKTNNGNRFTRCRKIYVRK